MDRIRVCWYCEKWQPGGIQALQVRLLKYFDTDKVSFDIAVSEDDTDLFDPVLSAEEIRKIVTLKQRYASPGKRTLHNIFAMKNIIRNGNYDVVHFNVCHGVELAYLFWPWLYRVPVRIVHCRNNDIGSGGKSRKIKIACHKIGKYLFNHCANVKLANSDLAARWLFTKRDIHQGKVRIIKNGIEADQYAFNAGVRKQIRESLDIDHSFVIGHIGHFNYQKNHNFLLHVAREVIKKKPETVLLLVGAGEKEQEIRDLAKELNIDDHVIFYGVTNDIPSVLDAMDVFVFPSHFEGFGNVLLEAQANGLKCFASKDVIPQSVSVTDNLMWIPLSSSYAEWADAIVKEGTDYIRCTHTKEITDAGYDIACMAAELQKIYLSSR